MNRTAKQSGEPKQFTEAERQETKAWLQTSDKRAEEDAKAEAGQKAAFRREIRTRRQKLIRESKRQGCTAKRRKAIKDELENLRGIENQIYGSELLKHPSARRPSAKQLGFDTETPGADEILEAATIYQALRTNRPHLLFAKLAKKDPARWNEVAQREARQNSKIGRAIERIESGDIKEVNEGKWSRVDRQIAENYFQSTKLKRPLRELSADWASNELSKLGVDLSPDAFDRALKRLALVF